MSSLNEISATSIINEDPETVTEDHSLTQIKNVMEDNNLRTVPVLDNEENLVGAVSYRDLIRFIQFNPEQTKIKKVMHQPPKFKEDASIVELAELRINSGKKMLVNTAGKKLKGVVTDQEFLQAFQEADELEKINTDDLDIENLVTVFEQDSLEEARHKMLDENISRLPVLDKNGKLTGLLRSTEILGTMVKRERINTGGRSGDRTGNEVKVAGGVEKEKMSEIPVEELMERNFLTSQEHFTAKQASKKMIENEKDEMVFVENKYPKSIIAVKDIIEYVSGFAPGQTILVSLTGIEVDEEKAAVHNKIRTQLQGSIGRKIKRPRELRMRFKKKDQDGKKHRYELDTRLDCEYGLISINEEGWDMLDTVDRSLDQLNKVLRKKKEKKSEHRA